MTDRRQQGLQKMNEVYGWEMPDIQGDPYFDLTVEHLFGDIWIGSLRHAKAVIEADDLAGLGIKLREVAREPSRSFVGTIRPRIESDLGFRVTGKVERRPEGRSRGIFGRPRILDLPPPA